MAIPPGKKKGGAGKKKADLSGHCGPGAYWDGKNCRDVVDDHIVPRVARAKPRKRKPRPKGMGGWAS